MKFLTGNRTLPFPVPRPGMEMTLSQLPPAEQLIPGPRTHLTRDRLPTSKLLDRSFESFTRSDQEELLSAIGKLLVVEGTLPWSGKCARERCADVGAFLEVGKPCRRPWRSGRGTWFWRG